MTTMTTTISTMRQSTSRSKVQRKKERILKYQVQISIKRNKSKKKKKKKMLKKRCWNFKLNKLKIQQTPLIIKINYNKTL
jgi:hypothetical protein